MFPIFFLFSNNVNSLFIDELIVPLLLTIIVTIVIWIALSVILNSKIKSGFITSLGLVLFFSYGHIYMLLDEIQHDSNLSHLFLLIPFFILFGLGSYYFIKTKNSLKNIVTIVNVIAISLIMISIVSIVEYQVSENLFTNKISEGTNENLIQLTNIEDLPDIYYIILDGYGGSKSLQTLMDYDNSEFISFLTNKGFFVSTESFSNYRLTAFSVPATLNMKYLNYLEDGDGQELKKLNRDSMVFQYLKSQGYNIVVIEAGFKPQRLGSEFSDFHLCHQQAASEFGIMLVQTTMLNPIHVQLFGGEHRNQILCGFSELEKMSDRNFKPKFVFAHILIPHAPYVFGANGEELNPKSLSLLDNKVITGKSNMYLEQLKFSNVKISEVIEKLIETDTPPIIIIQSDHGPRAGETQDDYEWMLRHFNNFEAYYFPGKGKNIELETTTSVNTFRILFNTYFNENYTLLDDKMYYNTNEQPFNLTDVTELLGKK